MLLPIPSAINRLPIWNARYAPFFQWYLNTHNINPSPGNCTYFLKWAPRFRSRKCNFCFQFFATWVNQKHYTNSSYDMGGWFDGSAGIEQFWWLNKTILAVSTCAWFRETVMRRGLYTMYGQSPSLSDPVQRGRHVVIGPTLAGSTGVVQSCLC